MVVLNIVANVSPVNSGVWGAALVGTRKMMSSGVKVFLVVCDDKGADGRTDFSGVTIVFLGKGNPMTALRDLLYRHQLSPAHCIVVSHGSWLSPTKLGRALARDGYNWVYVPQGMLEPWSLRQGALKKRIYFTFFERRFIRLATVVRAVSSPEERNLSRLLGVRARCIGNGVAIPEFPLKPDTAPVFVFMARLHHKKGITPLVKAWARSMGDSQASLIIAGPDEGELTHVKRYLAKNVTYIGPAYGEHKRQLLRSGHYYILPSLSEGFPTSVLEAMSYGMIPIISPGCNFPEVFELNLGYRVEPTENSIADVLPAIANAPFDHALSRRNHSFISENYSDGVIGENLLSMYQQLLPERTLRDA